MKLLRELSEISIVVVRSPRPQANQTGRRRLPHSVVYTLPPAMSLHAQGTEELERVDAEETSERHSDNSEISLPSASTEPLHSPGESSLAAVGGLPPDPALDPANRPTPANKPRPGATYALVVLTVINLLNFCDRFIPSSTALALFIF